MKKILLFSISILLGGFLIIPHADAAIAFDAVTEGGCTDAASLTFAKTNTGSNLYLVVEGRVNNSATDDFTSVTYAGTAMTKALSTKTSTTRFSYLYFLMAPASGTNNVVISSAPGSCGAAISYSGVGQTGQPDSSANNNGSGVTTLTNTTTVVGTNCWLVSVGYIQYTADTAITGGAGTTIRNSGNVHSRWIADSNGTVGTGAQSLIINNTDSTPFSNIDGHIISFCPPSAAATTDTTTTLFSDF